MHAAGSGGSVRRRGGAQLVRAPRRARAPIGLPRVRRPLHVVCSITVLYRYFEIFNEPNCGFLCAAVVWGPASAQ